MSRAERRRTGAESSLKFQIFSLRLLTVGVLLIPLASHSRPQHRAPAEATCHIGNQARHGHGKDGHHIADRPPKDNSSRRHGVGQARRWQQGVLRRALGACRCHASCRWPSPAAACLLTLPPPPSQTTGGPASKRTPAAKAGRTPLSDKIAELEESLSSKTLQLQGEQERHRYAGRRALGAGGKGPAWMRLTGSDGAGSAGAGLLPFSFSFSRREEINELTQLHKVATEQLTGMEVCRASGLVLAPRRSPFLACFPVSQFIAFSPPPPFSPSVIVLCCKTSSPPHTKKSAISQTSHTKECVWKKRQ